MTRVAVTGVSGLVGQRLLPRLAALDAVERIVGVDVRDPLRRAPRFDFHRIDLGRAELKPVFEGVDVVVHLAAIVDPVPDEALMVHANVEGTRRLLDAAAAVGVRKLVRVSPSWVYGAWANNPVPLTEDAPLRPNEGFAPPVHAAEVERLLAEWHAEHPGVVVTVLRSAPVLGGEAERLPARLVLGRPLLRVRGDAPPVQVVHVDDLVAALVLAIASDLPGAYNVAAEGWLDPATLAALRPRAAFPPLPAEALQRLLSALWTSGLGDVPPGVVPYLRYPCVISCDRLRARGWAPRHTNEEVLREALATLPAPVLRRRVALAVGGVLVAGAAIGVLLRRRVRGRRSVGGL